MAAIDGLLALVEIQKASGLVLVTGEVPALLVGGATRPLSMPALAPALFDALIDELLDPEQRERLRAQATVELVYRSNRNNKSFNVTAQSTGERTVLRFVVGGALAARSTSAAVRRPAPSSTACPRGMSWGSRALSLRWLPCSTEWCSSTDRPARASRRRSPRSSARSTERGPST